MPPIVPQVTYQGRGLPQWQPVWKALSNRYPRNSIKFGGASLTATVRVSCFLV